MNLSSPNIHLVEGSFIDDINNEDGDDSTIWEFDSLSEESTQDKECDVVHIPTQSVATKPDSTSSLDSTSLQRVNSHQASLEAGIKQTHDFIVLRYDEPNEEFQFQTLFLDFFRQKSKMSIVNNSKTLVYLIT